MRNIEILLTFVVGTILFSCTGRPQLMPNISGKAGEVVIVINKGDWASDPGIALRSVLASEQPYLQQKEPMFDLIDIPEKAFTSIFQTHRNIIILNTVPGLKNSEVLVQENVWAAPQIVITISSSNAKSAAEFIVNESDMLTSTILLAERNRNIQNAKKYEEKSLRDLVTSTFGGSPFFPKGYNLRKRSDNFIWISYETTYTIQGILIYSYPYIDSSDFTEEKIILKRNQMLFRNVPGSGANTYMTTDTLTKPSMRWVNFNKRNFVEIRGLWEVHNDFMSGPFVDHVFLDKMKKNVIVLEAFVHDPKYNKSNYLRQVESIIYSFEFF